MIQNFLQISSSSCSKKTCIDIGLEKIDNANYETQSNSHCLTFTKHEVRGAWWLIGRFVAFRPKGRGSESRSSSHIRTLGKSFIRSCLWHFGMKLQHSIWAVSEVPLSSSDFKRRYRNSLNKWMNEWMNEWSKHNTAGFSTTENQSQIFIHLKLTRILTHLLKNKATVSTTENQSWIFKQWKLKLHIQPLATLPIV